MNNKLVEDPCIYYDDHLNEKRKLKMKKDGKKGEGSGLGLARGKIGQRDFNREYFPKVNTGTEDSSTESNATAKMRNSSYSRMKGVRPKPTSTNKSKSVSLSEQSTKKQLFNQISHLASQLESKNKALIKISSPERIKQAQVQQLYRVIHFYEGKIKQLEQQIKRYQEVLEKIGRECDEKSRHKSEVEQMVKLFEAIREENTEQGAKLEEKDYTIGLLQQKIHKQQIKLNFLTSKQSFLKKSSQLESQSNKSLSLTKNHLSSAISAINLKEKQQSYGNLQSKINKIEASLNFFKKENQVLAGEIQERDRRIFQMEKRMLMGGLGEVQVQEQKEGKRSSNYIKEDPLNQVTLLSASTRSITSTPIAPMVSKSPPLLPSTEPQPEPELESQQSPPSSISSHSHSQTHSSPSTLVSRQASGLHLQIFQKLRYQLLTEQTTFQQLIDFLTDQQLEPELLEQFPYNLKTSEAEYLISWLNKLSLECQSKSYSTKQILVRVIPKFENFTLRKENNLKIQVANVRVSFMKEFMNREAQFMGIVEMGKDKIGYAEMEGYFRGWGLDQEHLDTIGKSYYEETGEIEQAYLGIVKSIINKWASK